MEINHLVDLNSLRSAPTLSKDQRKEFLREIESEIINADWMTVGIMAPSDFAALEAMKAICKKYSSINFRGLDSLTSSGSVFLKGNQKTGNVYIRSENGLGEGILLTCQYENKTLVSNTYGPLPLDFFKDEEYA